MLNLPDKLDATAFLEKHWQKKPLFMPRAMPRLRPSISRNELAWLATHDDVESRIVFIERNGASSRYRAENGPFDDEHLRALPKRDWTLLVHDVEKHIPAMRALLRAVPFVPDWRIDDLMVSFAAPGGGVGPHRDNYDVFLCQGIGVRNWHYSNDDVTPDPAASDDLALLHEFDGTDIDAVEGDVLYLPPGVAHWGTARRACMTYSIGMRAPEAADLAHTLQQATPDEPYFYRDPDLRLHEAQAGYISPESARRAADLMSDRPVKDVDVAIALGVFATRNKDWLKPDCLDDSAVETWLQRVLGGAGVKLHGMAQLAFDDRYVYANGEHFALVPAGRSLVQELCTRRCLGRSGQRDSRLSPLLVFLLARGVFELPENP